MEFTKDIIFDNSLTAGKDTTITYSGSLFQNGANNVNIVFGFSENWENTTTKPMEKTENGFVTSIRMKEFDTFNFCFSDENNNWDNNNYCNYISPILPDFEKIVENNDNEIDYGTDYSGSIDDIIEDILGNTTKQDIVADKDNSSIDKILESINEEALPEIEELFNDLFFESYKEEEKSSPAAEISMDPALAEELKEVGDSVENISAPIEDATPIDERAELIKLFDELFEISSEPINVETASVEPVSESPIQEIAADTVEEPKINASEFDLNGLVSDLLEPVVTSETEAQKVAEDTSLFEDVKSHEDDEETSLAIINSGEFAVSSRKLSYFYRLRKRIKVAFIKLARASKELAKQIGL